MKFRNITPDVLNVKTGGELLCVVEPGETTPDLSRDEAKGFVLQTERWAAVGEQPKAAQKKAADTAAKENS